MKLQVTGACAAPGGASLTVKMSGGVSTFDYHADVQYTGATDNAYRVANGNLADLSPGYDQLSWRSNPGTFNAAAIGMLESGTVTMHALVVRDGETLTVDGYVFESGTDCQVQAQVTSSS
jgi:hypothetical protein